MDLHKSIQEFLRELKSCAPNNQSDNEKLLLRYNKFILVSIDNYRKVVTKDYPIDWGDVYQDTVVALLEMAKEQAVRADFSVYIEREIISAIQRSIEQESQFRDFICRLILELAIYRRYVRELRLELKREPTTAEIARQLRVPPTQIARLKRLHRIASDYELLDP